MSTNILIEADKLKKSFDARRRGLMNLLRGGNVKVYAVDDVSFTLRKGEILGFIGESGCGKSTTAKLLIKLLRPDGGKLVYKGRDITSLSSRDLREYRQKVQIVFQDPYEYLNPRINLMEIVTEPLVVNNLVKSQEEKRQIAEKQLETVGLIPGSSYLYRFSHELSGGQRQRVAIARAIVMNPELIIADEPTSMLDVSVRAGILNLLLRLKKDFGLSMVFITHDIATAGYMCDRIAVMYKGRIVEIGTRDEIIYNPMHPYTKALIGVAMELNQFLDEKDSYIKEGEVDSYMEARACAFEERCVNCDVLCSSLNEPVALRQVGDLDHYVACCKCEHQGTAPGA